MSVCQPKWNRRPDERPAQIRAAALEVFSQKGYSAATMDAIAHAAGVTKGTIYLYFGNKKSLFLDTLRCEAEQVLEQTPEMSLAQADDVEALAGQVAGTLLDVLYSPTVLKIMSVIMAEGPRMPELRALYQQEIMPRANLELAGVLEAAMGLGILRKLDPIATARALLGMFLIFPLTQEIFGAKHVTPLDRETMVDTIVTLFLRGALS